MRPAKTLYDALGLDATATTEQVKTSAASLLERLNSDGAAHSEDRANQIKIIAYARETLSDPAKRARYDQSLQRQAAVVVEQVSSTPASSGTPMTHWLLFAVGAAAMAGAYFFYQQKRAASAPVAAPVAPTSAPVRAQPVPTDNAQTNAVPQQVPPAPLAPAPGAPAVTPATTGELSAAEVFRRNQYSIVVVRGNREDGRGVTQGSGVVIEDAEVVTNCHVALGTTNLVVIAGGKSIPARVRFRDSGHDLCQLSVPSLRVPAVVRAPLSSVAVGARVYAIGAPQGLDLTLSDGVVASLRSFEDTKLIQTNAAISPGSSGGGLFDASGRLIGITTFQSRNGQNLNFAVPADWIDLLPKRNGNMESLIPDSSATSGMPEVVKPRQSLSAEGENNRRLLLGKWNCHAGGVSTAQTQYDFREDGSLSARARKGDTQWSNHEGNYQLASATELLLADGRSYVSVQLVEISATRVVMAWQLDKKVNHYCSRPG